MKSIANFRNQKISATDSTLFRAGARIYSDTPGKGKDCTVLRDGQCIKFITGVGLFDGVPRD